jgi:hypothetical protein
MWYDHRVHIEETEILIHFVVCSTENDQNFILSHFAEDKKSSDFHLEPFFRKEKNSELYYSLGTIPRKIKMLIIPFLTILHKRKILGISFQTIKSYGTIDGVYMMVLDLWTAKYFFCFYVVYFAKLNLFAEFVPFLSEPFDARTEMHGINRNEHFFPRNEHFFRGITETIPSLFRGFFSERNFDGIPNQITKEHPARHSYI